MKSCPACHFAFTDPNSPEEHRAHRDHHMKKFPRAGETTREALDELVNMYERRRQVQTVKSVRSEGTRS